MTKEQAQKRLAEIEAEEAMAWVVVKEAQEMVKLATSKWQPMYHERRGLEEFLKVVDK